MPIYEYGCKACGAVFEEWLRHADDVQEQSCPKCDGTAHRLISNTSFVLKGGGWYVTEYGNRKSEAPSSSDSAPTDAAPKADAPDAKPAAAPPPAAKAETAPAASAT